MTALRQATPADAKRLWATMDKPSTRLVAEALQAEGLKVNKSTVARWLKSGFLDVKLQPPQIAQAKKSLARAAAALTNPGEAMPAEFVDMRDHEMVRTAARELCSTLIILIRRVRANPGAVEMMPKDIGVLVMALSNSLASVNGSFDLLLQSAERVINATPTREVPAATVNDPLLEALEAFEGDEKTFQ